VNKKIDLPYYCNSLTGKSEGGNKNCDHDYLLKTEYDICVEWICSICGMKRSYEVYD